MMTSLMTAPLAPVTAINARLVGRLTRTYDRAIRAEENAPTEAKAWRLAKVSERCLRDLQAARAGLPLPEAKLPRTARNLAKQGLAALATIGRVIARALRTEAALRKAQAAATLARVARKAARLVRQALRATVRAVARRALLIASIFVVTVTPIKESSMNVPQLAARIHAGQGHNCCQVSVDGFDGNATDSPDGGHGLLAYTDRSVGLAMHVELRGDRFVFTGGLFGEHSLAAQGEITSAARLLAHWNGYVATNVERATGGAS